VSAKSYVTRKQIGKEQENKGITNCRAQKTDSGKKQPKYRTRKQRGKEQQKQHIFG
jgi:hypothetical protein